MCLGGLWPRAAGLQRPAAGVAALTGSVRDLQHVREGAVRKKVRTRSGGADVLVTSSENGEAGEIGEKGGRILPVTFLAPAAG